MLSVEMHTQVYREQYADVVRAAQHQRLVRSATASGEGTVKRGVASWLSSRVQRQQRPASVAVCCPSVACC